MLKLIQGQVTLVQYFIAMLVSTVCLISVVAAAYFLPHDKNLVAIIVLTLSLVSLMSSGRIISLTLHKKDY